jgi:large subunit ribosomal protein L4
VSADETKNTPDVEATEPAKDEPAKDEAAQADAVREEAAQVEAAAAKKPAARKPAARKPAARKPAAKAEGEAAAVGEPDAGAPPSEAPVGAAPAASDEAKPKRPARKPAAKAEAEAAGKPAARPGRKAAEAPARPARKAPAEVRHGKAGVATVVDVDGNELETRDLNMAVFGVAADVNALHLVVRAEQAARRRGTASTRTRGEVAGSTAKLFRQKGTGRARAGSVKSPLRTGGGTVFGPKPRSYGFKVNRKVTRKALAMALSNRAENGNVYVAAGLQIDEPSTARVNEFLVNLDIAAPVLVVTSDEPAVAKSVRNLFYAETAEVGALSTEQVLRARSLVLTEKAFDALNQA